MKDKLLIFGVTGSLGQALAKHYYKRYRIYGIARNEHKLFNMKRKYPNIQMINSDIRTIKLTQKYDYIINTAALKHISTCMNNPNEAIDININGLNNLIEQSLKWCNKRFIQISTDKAIEPINLYGATKLIGEKLVFDANKTKPIFNIVRFGNLFGSSGSILEILKNEKKAGINEHNLTHIDAERYFISFNEAIKLIQKALKEKAGKIIYKKVKAIKIRELVKIINPDAQIKIVGLAPGEKIKEKMSLDDDGIMRYYTKDEIIDMLGELE